jgi:Ca2+-binding EF-hand superfamily protein
MTRLAYWLSCIAACFLLAVASAAEDSRGISGVTIHASAEPIPVLTEITINGQPAAAFWDKYFADLFAMFDRNGDGSLDRTEAARVPQPASLLAEFRGDFDNVTGEFASPAEIDRVPADGKISPHEFAHFLLRAGIGEPTLRVASSATGLDAPSAHRIFELLATSPGSWSMASLNDAYRRLRALDANDDERLSFAELSFSLSERPASADTMKRKITFSPMLKVKATSSTSMKLAVRLDEAAPTVRRLDLPHGNAGSDELTADLGSVRLRLQAMPGNGGQDFDSSRQSLLQQFEADDLNHDQSLEAAELQQSTSGAYYALLLAVADRNSDGRLSSAELNRYLDLQASAAKHCVVVTASNLGSSLAAALDVDGDVSLSLRELRHGWPRVESWDRNRDGALAWKEVPSECRLTWSVGRPQIQPATRAATNLVSNVPHWFQSMDRNRDGDLSRHEFFGTLADFRRYDADRDGLISPAEAIAAKN